MSDEVVIKFENVAKSFGDKVVLQLLILHLHQF